MPALFYGKTTHAHNHRQTGAMTRCGLWPKRVGNVPVIPLTVRGPAGVTCRSCIRSIGAEIVYAANLQESITTCGELKKVLTSFGREL